MELKVGTNTYFTPEECEEIIASNFMSTDSKRIFWNNLPNEDKEILIVSTHKKIDKDAMCYVGRKVDINQNMQFPRIVNTDEGELLVECPYDIKLGIVYAMLDFATKAASDVNKLRELGIESYSDGSGASAKLSQTTSRFINGINKEYYLDYFKQYTILV